MTDFFSRLKNSKRLALSALLFLMSVYCFGLFIIRYNLTQKYAFFFLNWNLFLAFIPFAFSSFLILFPKLQRNGFIVFFFAIAWLLFFPNAPYIMTDLLHLKDRPGSPKWFDLLLILSFAWTGLAYGIFSLLDMETILENFLGKIFTKITVIIFLFAGAFGIYLGRFLRWNSWDILQNPNRLLLDITDRFAHPYDHPKTWAVTLFMGFLLNMIYWSVRFVRKGSVS